jgi:hypothetical protein
MATGNKTLKYYLSLPYTIEIIPDVEDGGYVARIKELPGCLTQADTWEELPQMIDEAKAGWRSRSNTAIRFLNHLGSLAKLRANGTNPACQP